MVPLPILAQAASDCDSFIDLCMANCVVGNCNNLEFSLNIKLYAVGD